MGEFYTSVHLDKDLCKGCINCIKRCPTEAIRVRNGKAVITKEYCIDCGECIRICKNHAKLATTDSMDNIHNYKYVVALPAPSLYAQANNLDDVNIVLSALKEMGFDDVFEVSAAAEVVSLLSRKYIEEHKDKWPIISTACPSIVRLIRVRFPNLLEHLMPIKPPMEIAAEMARKRAIEKTGLPSEDIGIFFLSPCPAKVTSVKSPIGYEKSNVDQVVAIKDIYPKLISAMTHVVEENKVEDLSESGRIGIGWGRIGRALTERLRSVCQGGLHWTCSNPYRTRRMCWYISAICAAGRFPGRSIITRRQPNPFCSFWTEQKRRKR